MRIGILYSRLRIEEKWLFAAFDERAIEYDRLLDREVTFDLTAADDWQRYDAVIIRSLSTSRGLYAAQALNSIGVP
ncbi:MAG: lysine biosynthesis protein LysX, partial [Anaerolineales bacterium]|nr:lysine biosynthesis protein LysX [Anaerolineales bacterium]